jgi:hypothetical protein
VERVTEQAELNETDKAAEEVNKLDLLGERVKQYQTQLMPEMEYFIGQHNHYLTLIDETGFNDPEMDAILLGPGMLAKIRIWYSMARKEAYNVAGKCRDLQKFYLAVAEQGKSNQYERVRLGQYDKRMNNATDAKEIARRVGGRLEEKAAYWEGEYMRWHGIGDAYEQAGSGCKDLFELAMYEYTKTPVHAR